MRLGGQITQHGDRLTRLHGLSAAKWQVLGVAGDGPRTTAQIARNLELGRQGVQRIVDWLLENGLVELIDNPDHRRAKLVTLTAEGSQARAELRVLQQDWANQVSAHFSAEELQAALTVVGRLRDLLKAQSHPVVDG